VYIEVDASLATHSYGVQPRRRRFYFGLFFQAELLGCLAGLHTAEKKKKKRKETHRAI
jgi:hypothetical protein